MSSGSDPNRPTTRVLVTGVRGKTGVALAALLRDRGDVEVLGGSSDPTRVGVDGVRATRFDWDDPDGWGATVTDVDAVFVVRPDRPDAPSLVASLVGVVASTTRVVLLSERSADHLEIADWALGSERAVREGGRPWTILRPTWFMQVLTDERFHLADLADDHALPFSSGGASLAWIDARDIAAVAVRALLDDDLDGAVLELTGPHSLSLPQTVERVAAAVGRPVEHRELSIDEALAGTDGFDRELLESTLRRVHDGTFAPVTDTVERVTGRPPRTLEEFLADEGSVLRRA